MIISVSIGLVPFIAACAPKNCNDSRLNPNTKPAVAVETTSNKPMSVTVPKKPVAATNVTTTRPATNIATTRPVTKTTIRPATNITNRPATNINNRPSNIIPVQSPKENEDAVDEDK